jgi:hypothetical protein
MTGVLETLREQLAELDRRRAMLLGIIDAVTEFTVAGASTVQVPMTATAKAARPPKTVSPKKTARRKLTPAQLAEMKLRFERGDSAKAMAAAADIAEHVVYYHAKKGGWKRKGSAQPAKARTTLRTCECCSQRTDQDPCEHCGEPWSRV